MKVIHEIELRSDTMTKPTLEMRKAMFNAVVGDDGYGEDPTVRELEEMGARIFGKEACRYFPTGLMGNLASVMSHCWDRGSEVLLGDLSHIHLYEQGGISTLANIHARTVRNYPDGTFSVQELEEKIRPYHDVHQPRTSLICLENTHNRCSGAVLPLNFIDDVSRVARSHNLNLHVDGARIFNASVALGVPVDQVVAKCDSVSVCLSKGLGCPIGTLVAGSREFIERATRCRKVLGGSMRQAGVVAATGIVALNSMINRLADDHTHARMIAEAINSCKSEAVSVDLKRVQSNLVFLKVNPDIITTGQFCDRMKKVTEEERDHLGEDSVSVKVNPFGEFVRIVTHNDVSYEDTLLTIKKLKFVISELDNRTPGRNGISGNGMNGIH